MAFLMSEIDSNKDVMRRNLQVIREHFNYPLVFEWKTTRIIKFDLVFFNASVILYIRS